MVRRSSAWFLSQLPFCWDCLGVAAGHPAAPAVRKAASLDGLGVAELDSAVGEHHAEKPRETGGAKNRLDPVQRADRAAAGVLVEHRHQLQLVHREVQRQDAPGVAAASHDGVHLHGARPERGVELQELVEGAVGALDDAVVGHLFPGLVSHLLRQVDVGKAHQAGLDVGVHRALGYRHALSTHRPDGLDAPSALQIAPHCRYQALELLGTQRYPLARRGEPFLVGDLRFHGDVVGLEEAAAGPPVAARAHERRALDGAAPPLGEVPADLPAPHAPAAPAKRDLAAAADVPPLAVALFLAQVLAPVLGHAPRPVGPYLPAHRRGRDSDVFRYGRKALSLLDAPLDLDAVVNVQMLSAHHVVLPASGTKDDRRLRCRSKRGGRCV